MHRDQKLAQKIGWFKRLKFNFSYYFSHQSNDLVLNCLKCMTNQVFTSQGIYQMFDVLGEVMILREYY